MATPARIDAAFNLDAAKRELLDLSERCLAHAANCGASAAELSLAREFGMSVTWRGDDVELVEYNRDKHLSVTLLFGKKSGSAQTADFSDAAMRQTIEAARNIAQFTDADEYNGLADPDLLAVEFPDLDLYHPRELDLPAAIEHAARMERAAMDYDARISNSEGATYAAHTSLDIYANSNAFRGVAFGTSHSGGCSVIAGNGDNMHADYWYDEYCNADELESPERIGQRAAKRAVRRLGARKIATGKHPVLFAPEVAPSLASHLARAVSGGSLYRKASFLLDKKGEKIFPDFVRIHEQPQRPRASASRSFDNDGVATRARDIVKDGVLLDYALSAYSARKLGLTTTGNAGGLRNLTVDASQPGGLSALLKQMHRGVLVTELIGFGVNGVTGDYSRGAFGFWVDHGEIQHPMEEFTIAGNLRDMFQNLIAVGDDHNPHRSIRCGSVLLDAMTVAAT